MTSEQRADEVYVWIWLPGATSPVVAGRLYRDGRRLSFNYGRSYLSREDAIPIYAPELPLKRGAIPPADGLELASCLRDAAPDSWGRRVILNRTFGTKGHGIDVGALDELTYLLESGSDRVGALDFQTSPDTYVSRAMKAATLEQLQKAAALVEEGVPLPPDLHQALFHGSSLGGARPKALLEEDTRKFIAKFSSSNDTYNVVKGEFIAMRLAAMAGLNVAPVHLEKAAGKDVLLIERFDRTHSVTGWQRKAMVSALTLFGLSDMTARYASYEDLAEIIRHRFTSPAETLRELYGRLIFNILCSNTDDHARNHAAFWDGKQLTLTPAYDICPQNRTGNIASQAMCILGESKMSTLALCLEAAPRFLLRDDDAQQLIRHQITAIRKSWDAVCDEADLAPVDRNLLRIRMFLNPYAFEGAPEALAKLTGR